MVVCAERGAGREGGRAAARARARPRPLPLPAPPPARPTGSPTPPSARPPGIPAAGRGGAHAQPSGPALAHLFSPLPHCERFASHTTADSRSTPASPTPPTAERPGKGVECACAPLPLGLGAWLLKGSQNVESEGALGWRVGAFHEVESGLRLGKVKFRKGAKVEK